VESTKKHLAAGKLMQELCALIPLLVESTVANPSHDGETGGIHRWDL